MILGFLQANGFREKPINLWCDSTQFVGFLNCCEGKAVEQVTAVTRENSGGNRKPNSAIVKHKKVCYYQKRENKCLQSIKVMILLL